MVYIDIAYIYIPTYLIPTLEYLSHRIKSYGVYIVSLNLGLDMLEKYLLGLLFLTCSSTNLITYLTNVEGFSIHTKGSLPPVSVGKLLFTSDIPNKNPSNRGDSYMPCTAMAHYPSLIKVLMDQQMLVILLQWYLLSCSLEKI